MWGEEAAPSATNAQLQQLSPVLLPAVPRTQCVVSMWVWPWPLSYGQLPASGWTTSCCVYTQYITTFFSNADSTLSGTVTQLEGLATWLNAMIAGCRGTPSSTA